jgi:hypothetical protein
VGKPGKEGAYTNQRFNFSNLGRLTEESRGFKPDLGNLAVRDYRGASGNVAIGGTVNPTRNRKSGIGNPPPKSGARPNSIPMGRAIRVIVALVNWQQEEPNGYGGGRQPSMDGTSRVTGDCHARFCERLGVKLPIAPG